MKYGHEYSQLLASEGFPAVWVSSAISYRELKKCIKKVQQELLALGLDTETLQHLPNKFGVKTPEEEKSQFARRDSTPFVPELWIAVDKGNGSFIDAGLTQDTRQHLSGSNDHDNLLEHEPVDDLRYNADGLDAKLQRRPSLRSEIRWVNIPLSTASTFFNLLDPKLAQLDAIQQAEEKRLEGTIITLGNIIDELTRPVTKRGKYKPQVDTAIWREILALYIDSTVFFSTYEQDHGSRTFLKAKSQLEIFSDRLVKQGLANKFNTSQSKVAFEQFVNINLDILKAMHFQELNNEAVRKILKKFDKRTALGAAKAYQGLTLSGPFAKSIATDMCAAISSKVVTVVPQMDDYTCPICCDLAWRPIRLGCCNSIYCIRCVIQLQKDDKDKCPMCRESSVMRATAGKLPPLRTIFRHQSC